MALSRASLATRSVVSVRALATGVQSAHLQRSAQLLQRQPAQERLLQPRRALWKQAFFEQREQAKHDQIRRQTKYIDAQRYEDDNPEDEEGWRFQIGVIIQRLPLLFAETPDWHAQYRMFEYERGLKAARYEELPLELRPEWVDPNARQTTLEEDEDDQKRKSEEELLLPPKLTPADYHQNTRHLYRKLQNSLYLILRHKQSQKWVFPQVKAAERSPLRLIAERSVAGLLGRKMRVSFVGNKPVGYLREKAENPTKQNKGIKTFFFHSLYAVDVPDPATLSAQGYDDFRWLTPAELQDYLTGDLKELSKEMIMPEEFDVATAEAYNYQWDETRQHYLGIEPEAYQQILDAKTVRTMFPYPEGHKVKPMMTTRPLPIHGFPEIVEE